MEQGARLWNVLYEAGVPKGLVPVGIGVYGTTGRLEKGYRAFGSELTPDYNLVEAGMARPSVKRQGFIGKDAYLAQRDATPAAILCTLTVDDHEGSDGRLRYMLGGEPVLTRDGRARSPTRGEGRRMSRAPARGRRSESTSSSPTCRPNWRSRGSGLAVEYMGERFPVTVAVAGSRPLFDPAQRAGEGLAVNILVCVKRVPMVGGRISLLPGGQQIDTRQLGFTISPHEECAVEEAVRLVERHGGAVTVLALGPPEAEEQLRNTVAVGAASAVLLVTERPDWGPAATAQAIVETIRRRDGNGGAAPFDLLLLRQRGGRQWRLPGRRTGRRTSSASLVSPGSSRSRWNLTVTAARPPPAGSTAA